MDKTENLEKRLNESEERFRIIAENARDILFTADLDMRLTYISPSVEASLGYTPDELMNIDINDLFAPATRSIIEDLKRDGFISSIEHTKSVLLDLELINKKGKAVCFEIRFSLLIESDGSYRGVVGVARDVTDKNKAEKAIRRSERKYRDMLDSMDDLVFTLDDRGMILYASNSSKYFFNLTSSHLIGSCLRDYTHPDDMDALTGFIEDLGSAEAAKSQHPVDGAANSIEFRIYPDGGELKWVEAKMRPFRDPKGNLAVIRGVARDVTRRKNADALLRASELRYRSIVESVHDGYYEVDLRGQFLLVNNSFIRIADMDREEILGKNFRSFTDKATAKEMLSQFNKVFRTREPVEHPTWSFVRKNGETFSIGGSISLIIDGNGNPSGFRGIIRDLTEDVRTKEVLLQSERNFRLLVENIHDGIFLSGDDDTIIYANRYALNMTGYSLEDLNALSVRDLIEKADITMIVDRYKERMKRKLDPNLYESIIRSKNGLSIPVEITMAETEWKGEMAHLIIFKDITERKKSERQLMESLEEKNTLLKEIHHRVKNNFQVITSLLSLQSRSLGDETLTEKFRDAQNRIRSMALIHEKLYQSQEFSGINFGDYIKLLVQELHQANRRRDSAVTIEIHSEDIDLNIAQAIPCGLILNELLTNSFKYAFTSTVSGNPTIEIDFREKSGMLCLSVADNGVGLPENLEISGLSSLGLSLVSLLAENQLDGEMRIRRSPGAGFTILFPRR